MPYKGFYARRLRMNVKPGRAAPSLNPAGWPFSVDERPAEPCSHCRHHLTPAARQLEAQGWTTTAMYAYVMALMTECAAQAGDHEMAKIIVDARLEHAGSEPSTAAFITSAATSS